MRILLAGKWLQEPCHTHMAVGDGELCNNRVICEASMPILWGCGAMRWLLLRQSMHCGVLAAMACGSQLCAGHGLACVPSRLLVDSDSTALLSLIGTCS
jgi:hypothetical protein